jgi:MFS family permease
MNAGHVLTMISLGVAHAGMQGLSPAVRAVGHDFGRRNVILIGLVTLVLGASLVPLTPDYWVQMGGLLLVGVGWSCVNVAVTALIADSVPPRSAVGRSAWSTALPTCRRSRCRWRGPLAEATGLPLAVLALLVTVWPPCSRCGWPAAPAVRVYGCLKPDRVARDAFQDAEIGRRRQVEQEFFNPTSR